MSKPLTFYPGGVHPPQNKETPILPIISLDLPRRIVLPLSQHIGSPAVPVVSKGDHVDRGSLVADASSKVSSRIHSSISGTVVSVGAVKSAYGYMVDAITIDASDTDHDSDMNLLSKKCNTDCRIDSFTMDDVRRIALEAGIVGLGGAAFPMHVKLSPPPEMKIDTLVVNGAECEPYLVTDHALMLSEPKAVIEGAVLAMKGSGAVRAIIGVEENKRDAINLLLDACGERDDINIAPLKVKYPQGGERQLVKAVTGREINVGALPASAGVVVQNVATIYALWRAVVENVPLIERIVTVTGVGVKRAGNYRVTIGTAISELIKNAGGMPENTAKVILGGPMMGKAAMNMDAPVIKGLSGVIMLPDYMAYRSNPKPCVRCSRCVTACPMGLEPYLLSAMVRNERMDDAAFSGIMNCIECGSCSFVCPSWRPLLDDIRCGKGIVRQLKKKSKN